MELDGAGWCVFVLICKYLYVFVCIYKGLRPPAAGPLLWSWNLVGSWLVMLASDCWLVTTGVGLWASCRRARPLTRVYEFIYIYVL